MKTVRKPFFDIAKGIGIYTIVLVHFTAHGSWLSQLLLSFCVPFFYIVSGMLFSTRREPKQFILNMIQHLLMPLLAYGLIDVVFTAFRYWVMEGQPFSITELMKMFLRVTFVNGSASSNGPLWYLLPLMFTQLILYPLVRSGKKWIPAVLILMFIAGYFVHFKGPFRIGNVPSAFVCFGIGMYMKPMILKLAEASRKIQMLLFLATGILFGITCWLNGSSEMAARNYGNIYPLYYIVAISATISLLSFSMLLDHHKILSFYGINSLTVMCCHYYFARYISVWIMQAMHCEELRQLLIVKVLLSLLTMLLMYPIILLVNRYIPVLTGKRELRYLPRLFRIEEQSIEKGE